MGYLTQHTGPPWSPGRSADVSAGVKKIVGWLAIALVAFYLITNPADAAGAVRGIGSFISDAFQSIIAFLTSVFS